MKAIEKPREWYQSKKDHCDALIKDIVLSGHKAHGEHKEDRSQQEEKFIEGLEHLKGYVDRLEDQVNLPSKLEGAIAVLKMVAHWGLGNNDVIIKVIENIKNSLEEQARRAKEEDIQPSLELLGKQAPLKNKISTINFKQIKRILRTKVNGQTKNKNEVSISPQNNQKSVYEVVDLRFLIAEFLEDVRDKLRFLFSLSKSLALDSKITGNLNLYRYRKVVTSEVFSGLVIKTKVIEKLNLSWCRQITDENIAQVIQQNPNLTSLDLSYTNITDGDLNAWAPYLGKLTSLDLYHTKINDVGLKAVAPYLGNLTSLRLEDTKITDEGLKALAPSLRNLTILDFRGCYNITDEGLKALAPYLGNLTSLNLSGCGDITNKGLKALVPYLGNLTILDLWKCQHIANEGLEALVPYLGNLTSLKLSNTNITDEGFKAIVRGCPQLRVLMGCDTNTLNRLRSEVKQEQEERDNSFSFT